MNNSKIIGFLIHPENINIPLDDIDVFNAGLNFISFEKFGYKLIFWGIGNIESLKFTNKISFRRNQDLTLEDRNIVVDFSGNEIIIENDRLGSIPVFYNKYGKIISTLSLKCLYNNWEYDLEGIHDYFKAGYCLYGNTTIKDVKFLRYYSKIVIKNNQLYIEQKEDDCPNLLKNTKSTPSKLIKKISDYVNNRVLTTNNIIIPTSGGFDSRFLNSIIKDKNKIKSYSYGISKDPYKSFETLYAKELSCRLKTYFKIVELNQYYNEDYLTSWFKIFGISSHIHGMYHIEFYKKILNDIHDMPNPVVLSGIVGDAWSGKVVVGDIKSMKDMKKLFYSHGVSIEENILLKNVEDKSFKKFYEDYKYILQNEQMRIIFLIRTKLILLSYLMIIPEYLGLISETPYLNKDIAISILSLPTEERSGRKRQINYFKEKGIYFEKDYIKADISNYLDQITLSKTKNIMKLNNIPKFINNNFVKNINHNLEDRNIENKYFNVIKSIFGEKLAIYLKFGLNKFFGIRRLFNKNLDALYYYLILKVFEYVEQRR